MFIGFLIIITVLVLVAVAYLQLPLFGANPTGERLAKIQTSPHYKNGQFHNLSDTPTWTGESSIIKGLYRFLFEKDKNVAPKSPIPSIKTDLNTLPKNKDYFVWLGHSSYLLHLNQKNLFD